jgi:predicted regulator of Ras-like GTPase activity (Roadblock/LC7/MglB family)
METKVFGSHSSHMGLLSRIYKEFKTLTLKEQIIYSASGQIYWKDTSKEVKLVINEMEMLDIFSHQGTANQNDT